MATTPQKYDITLNKDLFVDPNFEKIRNYSDFFPVKFKTIEHRNFEKLSASSRSLLIHLLSLSYTQGSPKITVSVVEVPSYRGTSVENLFLELSNSNYLELSNIIEKKEYNKKEYKSTERPKAVAVVAPKTLINLLSKQVEIPNTLVQSWADTYPKEYLELELKKARSWLITNPHKAPKTNFGRFFNSWFDRGWEKYRQTLKSNPTQLTVEALEELLRKDAE